MNAHALPDRGEMIAAFLRPAVGIGTGGEEECPPRDASEREAHSRHGPRGQGAPEGKAIGRTRVMTALLDVMAEDMGVEPEKVCFGIVHVGAPDIAPDVRERLIKRYGDVEILSAPASPVISTHLGTGAWGVAYLVEDPAK